MSASYPLVWKNRKALWTKVGKAGSIGVQVIPGTKSRLPTLTNGHFAVAVGRALVKDCEAKAGTTFEKMSGTARNALPAKLPKTARAFERTPALTEAGGQLYRVYKDHEAGEVALYGALYLEFLGDPEKLYAVGVDAVAVDDPAEASLWIMPRHLSDDEKAILSPNGTTPTPKAAPEPKATPKAAPQPVPQPAPAPKATPKPAPAPAREPEPEPVADDAAAVAVGAEVEQQGSWLWARFPSRPAAEIREAMKAAGWRWSRRRGAWYLRPVKAAA